MRYVAFGARHQLSQLPRLERGLRGLGHVEAAVGSAEVDLVYANDEPRWQEAIDYRAKVAPAAKLILCVLDLPEHTFPSFNPAALYDRLRCADRVVTISAWVQSQVYRYYGIPSVVIGQPIKDVSPDKRAAGVRPYPQYRVLMAGRLRDPGKRASLAINALMLAGFGEGEVAVVGGEWPGWGTDLGVVSDDVLGDLYASVDYVMGPSSFEGLGLPPLEGVAAGAIPIVCSDCPTAPELYPRHWLCYPHPHALAYRLTTLNSVPEILAEEKDLVLRQGEQVRRAYSAEAVARRLVSVYESIIQTS